MSNRVRHCTECGCPLPHNAKYCICGEKIEQIQTTSAIAEPLAEQKSPIAKLKSPQRCHSCHQVRRNHTCTGSCDSVARCGQPYLHKAEIKQQTLKRKLETVADIQLRLDEEEAQSKIQRERIRNWIQAFVDFLIVNNDANCPVPWRNDEIHLAHAYSIAHTAIARVRAVEKGFASNKRIKLDQEVPAKPPLYSQSSLNKSSTTLINVDESNSQSSQAMQLDSDSDSDHEQLLQSRQDSNSNTTNSSDIV